ncbi:MAG: hypothetical protein K8R86_13395 [Bacteroidales bacterium]|nr:hypothetical protein [Bacteroidales bacterium]
MKLTNYIFFTILIVALSVMFGCGPKSVNSAREDLHSTSRQWIPFAGSELVAFEYDTNEWVFSGAGKEIYYENIRYMSDQSGFFQVQEDYYADMERQELTFDSPSTPYFIEYYLERNKGEVGTWDIIKISVGDGDYYKNEMKIVTYETESYDKGEIYSSFSLKKTLNGIVFDSVYYSQQERRPFGVYYTKRYGVIAFKVASTELWVIKQETINQKNNPD